METHQRQQEVLHYANYWRKHCAIKFLKVDDPNDSDIRIRFEADKGSWSYVGTDCTWLPMKYATMNLELLRRLTLGVLYFMNLAMHLGWFMSTMQRPKDQQPFEWNKPAMIKSLSGYPNFWDKATIQL